MALKLAPAALALILLAGCGDPAERTIDAPQDVATAEPEAAEIDAEDESAEPEAIAANTLTCTDPVKPDDTAASLLERFGNDARTATLAGGEGTEIPGVELFYNDPARALEVGFDSEAREKVAFVRAYAPSQWSAAGVATGNTLENVVTVNGGPIKFYGFEWDYSGAVFDLGGGTLDQLDGCSLIMGMTFDYDGTEMPDSLMGDGEVSSDSEEIPEGAVTVNEIGITFAG